MALFKKGHNLATGRPKGSKNRYNRDIRQVFHDVYEEMGSNVIDEKTQKPLTGHEAMLAWARTCPTEFYRLYGKMIPSTTPPETDGHEDFVDELIFEDEMPELVEAVDVTDVGKDDHKQLSSGEYTPLIENDIPPPKEAGHDLV